MERPFTVEDLPAIEEEMRRIAAEDVPFVRSEMKKADAVKLFESRGENYKAEIIGGIDADTVSLYRCGEFLDLCRGPHLPPHRAGKGVQTAFRGGRVLAR